MFAKKRFCIVCLFSSLSAMFFQPATSSAAGPQQPTGNSPLGGILAKLPNPIKNPPINWIKSKYGEKPTLIIAWGCPTEVLLGISPPPVLMFHKAADAGVEVFNNSSAPFQIQQMCS